MKKNSYWLLVIIFMWLFRPIYSTSFDFESGSFNSITAENGTLKLTQEHYKSGINSLCWTTRGKSLLMISDFGDLRINSVNSSSLQIYSPEITNDTLVIEYLFGSAVMRKAHFLLNYKGWHECLRPYKHYTSAISANINSVRITLLTSSNEERRICFDDINLNRANINVVYGSQWKLDAHKLATYKGTSAKYDRLRMYANDADVEVKSPMVNEIDVLNRLRRKFNPSLTYKENLYKKAATFALSLNIKRNSDGSIHGKPIDFSSTILTDKTLKEYSEYINALAAGKQFGIEGAEELFHLFLGHVLDQGLSEGCPFYLPSNAYANAREIPKNLIEVLSQCTEDENDELIRLLRWLCFYHAMNDSPSDFKKYLNSDVAYLFFPHLMAICIYQNDEAMAIRDLYLFKRYLERHTEYVSGDRDILKPDGTGFHHWSHYNGYMYAYRTMTDYMSYLSNSPFRIDKDAYDRFSDAVISLYKMCVNNTNDNHYFSLALSGRLAFSLNGSYGKRYFEQLIDIGCDCYQAISVPKVESAYNYFFKTNKYNVGKESLDGFHQFNYSSLGIYRKNNWVTTMRCPTTISWGSETYSTQNCFGRYQSHGVLDVMYEGSLWNSGKPMGSKGAGWDWNMMPGTTTVHYVDWKEMLPGRSAYSSYYQYSKTTNFAGALSAGEYGIYGCEFDQGDHYYTSLKYKPTNLAFKKSVFCFDGIMLCLGSDICSNGEYSNQMTTATNLFQELIHSLLPNKTISVNGKVMNYPFTMNIPEGTSSYLLTPCGTGFYLPSSNQSTHIIFDNQTTPKSNGLDAANPTTSALVAKAYINHGVKTSNNTYCYYVLPASNTQSLSEFVSRMNNETPLFDVLSHNKSAHVVRYNEKNIMAYCIFDKYSNLTNGIFKTIDSPCLLIDTMDEKTGIHKISVNCPDMKPKTDVYYGWLPTPSIITMEINGEYNLSKESDVIQVISRDNGTTKLRVVCTEGNALNFELLPISTSLDNTNDPNNWLYIEKGLSNISIHISDEEGSNSAISHIYSIDGKMLKTYSFTSNLSIKYTDFNAGIHIITVLSNNRIYKCKIVIP